MTAGEKIIEYAAKKASQKGRLLYDSVLVQTIRALTDEEIRQVIDERMDSE